MKVNEHFELQNFITVIVSTYPIEEQTKPLKKKIRDFYISIESQELNTKGIATIIINEISYPIIKINSANPIKFAENIMKSIWFGEQTRLENLVVIEPVEIKK